MAEKGKLLVGPMKTQPGTQGGLGGSQVAVLPAKSTPDPLGYNKVG